MWIIVLVLTFTASSMIRLNAQVSSYGLAGHDISALRVFDDRLYAGAKDSGVLHRSASDTNWTGLGLEGRWITTISIDTTGGPGVRILAGVRTTGEINDTTRIYGYSPNIWADDDEGIGVNLTAINAIQTIDSGDGDRITFAVGDLGPIYRRTADDWESVLPYDMIGLSLNTSLTGEIWCSGQSGWGTSLLLKSTDLGETWMHVLDTSAFTTSYIYSIVFPESTSTNYLAGSYGLIWKSTGVTFDTVLQASCYFNSLAVNPFDRANVFAGGDCDGLARLYQSIDGGLNWNEITLPESLKGINALDLSVRDSLELFIGTKGDGVYRYAQASETAALTVKAGWNLVSLPRTMENSAMNELFPSAISPAYEYSGGYNAEDTLSGGRGYWVKFDSPEVIPFTGTSFESDTVDVQPGWNMIGSVSHPIDVSAIQTLPAGIVMSDYFRYDEGYGEVSALEPGRGYWVKVNQSGQMILSQALGSKATTSRIE